MPKKVLIAGGSGSIGTQLTKLLLEKNFSVSWLSRENKTTEGVKTYLWNYEENIIDDNALNNTEIIVNLAGAGIADKNWSKERKKILKESRIKTTNLLLNKIEEKPNDVKTYISASATGYYGYDSGSIEKKEGSRFGDDFLATLTKEWEAAADGFSSKGIRTVKLRTGFVVGNNQNGWEKIAKVVKTGFGAAVGSGDQYMSWVHIHDLCRIYLWAIENEKAEGVYNAVSPNPVTNKEFTRQAAQALKRPFFMPNVPGFILRLMYGEIASALLGSSRISSEKIQNEGFQFDYPTLTEALREI
ncbi:MAG TPA: TIGR01777 family oxidoreductase [Cyclobacteriaceae bacterium]